MATKQAGDDDTMDVDDTCDANNNEDDSSVTSAESHETDVWDAETVAAVARTTHKQMMQRQPILIGCNRDGTINVQLPNGSIIIAEASAFPSFSAKVSLANNTNGAYATPDTHKPLPVALPPLQTDRAPKEWEIQQLMPMHASAVFHIFHRRVNMDAFPSHASTYSLLRAWVQDDPYRYTFPDVEDPAQLAATNPEDEATMYPITSTAKLLPNEVPTNTTLEAIKNPPSSDSGETGGDLLQDLIGRGKKRRKGLTQRISARDSQVLLRLEEKGLFR